jgi:branched-chain amino acid transport system substrate-binding protein
VLCGGLVYQLAIKDMYFTPTDELRAQPEWPPSSVKIVVPWPDDGRMSLIQGVQLALEELNASSRPLANRVQVLWVDEPVALTSDGAMARRIAADTEVMAVIGHEEFSAAMAAAVTYEKHGILYLSPKATASRLTGHGFTHTFRLVPDDADFSRALAVFAKSQGWNRIGVLYGRFEQGEAMARWFQNFATEEGLVPVYFRSYLPLDDYQEHDFRELLSTMRNEDTDAILLSDQLPWAAKVLVDMQVMGFTQPILAGDKLDSSAAWTLAREAANNLYVASAVDPDSTDVAFDTFRDTFHARFGSNPGYGSSQGYEAFNLFINAAEESQSVDPIVVATTIRTNEWSGLFGNYSFSPDGAIVGRSVIIKRMMDGVFETVYEVTQ